ncbi:hypothetical protein P2H44_18110 [Albimonas sp. CAU 1670]|uniref:hypothetical protein n=1 Tax=Albimonas sp. CAU 1670 TaxID=3032599 RepID=UPI0023DB707E|nr:hypothetical protein [Albimonas sp. CAU 1670]MDF2234478.1 hypothetical protein [Albimonas sp. CAU 1670]
MRDLIFIDCGPDAAEQAELWAGAALARAGVSEAEAAAGAARLAEGVRAAAAAFEAQGGGARPQSMLVLSDEGGRLSFELCADGRLPRNAACACGDGAWTPADRAAAGDGAVRLTMAAVA